MSSFPLFKQMASRQVVPSHQVGMCAGGGVDRVQLGAREMLVEQPGGEREEGLAESGLIPVRAPARVKKWITTMERSSSNSMSASKWPRESL